MSFQPGATAGGAPIAIGTIIAYLEFTANVTVSGTSGAKTTVITAPTFTADGFTSYWIDFYSCFVQVGASDVVNIELWEAASAIGEIGVHSSLGEPIYARRKLTPAAGDRQYIVKAWRTSVNGTIYGNTGGAGNQNPGYICITKAA